MSARMQRDERGMSESLSWTVLLPLVMLCLLGFIQGAIWVHGRTVVTDAALAAAEAQSLKGARVGTANAVALDLAAEAGLGRIEVSAQQEQGLVTVEVAGVVSTFFGTDLLRVSARATRPVEES